jgi:hypothetical protein
MWTLEVMPAATPPQTDPSIDALVDATPERRDRVVDFLRAVSIGVVVLWHWTFSVTHWGGGSLHMPNPIGDVPGLWAATWLLQVMPLFFLVGGYANLAAWEAVVRSGGGATGFWAKRFSRLVRPVAVYLACWLVLDLAWQARGGHSVLEWGMVVFVPLWFLAVYVGVVALAPVTARWHARRPVVALAALGAGILVVDLARFDLEAGWAGPAAVVLVWVFCHQLGYWWRDWPGARPHTVRRGLGLIAAGLTGLVALTGLGPYPRSMVAVRGEDISNMNPPTACIAALAVLQLGFALAVRPQLSRWLQRRSVWRTVVAANGVAMTVFCWHMTALVGFLLAYEAAGWTLADQPTASWWLSRPVWIAGPALVLVGLLAVFARFELPRTNRGVRARARS